MRDRNKIRTVLLSLKVPVGFDMAKPDMLLYEEVLSDEELRAVFTLETTTHLRQAATSYCAALGINSEEKKFEILAEMHADLLQSARAKKQAGEKLNSLLLKLKI